MYCIDCRRDVKTIEHDRLGIVCAGCMRTLAYSIRQGCLKPGSKTRRLLKVAVRDKYICQLCKRKVNMSRTDDDMKPTLDHKLARSRGGPNAYANLQLAHGHCNRKKGSN